MSRPSDPKKWKDIDVSKGTRWKICLAALQVVFKNVCYFSPFNVEILKMLTFQWTATVFFDHLNGILQNQTQSVAVMSVSTSECPDDPEGKLWQSIAMEVSIAMEPKNAGWFISWKIPSRNG